MPAAISTPRFAPGEQLAPGLHAIELLGAGKRFETWLAWSARHWCAVAVKLPNASRPGPRALQALAREAATVSSLVHPSVQRLLESHARARTPHLAYEYVEGPTLDDLIEDEGPLLPDDVLRLGMQLAAILRYLHGRGIVHLDLKPGNLVLRDGRAILLDFDIARRIGERGSGRKPRGSPPFMAPEQVRCEPAAPSMDLFALGAVLYEAATCTHAFDVEGEADDRRYPQLEAPPPRVDGVPPAVGDAIERLLALDPRDRPPSADAALALLADALAPGEEGLWPDWADRFL